MLSFEVPRYFKSAIIKMLSLVLPFILITFDAFSQVSNVQTLTKMPNTQFNKSGDLIVTASPTSSCSDFDFLLGEHFVHHKKLKTRLINSGEWIEFDGKQTMQSLLQGIGNLEQHFMKTTDGKPAEGMAVRLFDPATRLWSIYWSDSNTGRMDMPVVGSFEDKVGHFFAKDIFNGKPILIQFNWDATDQAKPVWSQAFSTDQGKTWEWNWYMYFTRTQNETKEELNKPQEDYKIGVLELRNYVIKPGNRDRFIDFFEGNLITPQVELNGYPIGQYRIKGQENNFCWLRGFESMRSRSAFLPAFYYGPDWKKYRETANEMLANNDNIYLLRPVVLQNDSLVPAQFIKSSGLRPGNHIAVVELYTANNKLDQLMMYFAKGYLPALKEVGVDKYSLWISEFGENDFPGLPVFQDKNLLVMITYYKDELEYTEKMKAVESKLEENLKDDLQNTITLKNTWILYPTAKTAEQ
ncbi:MAG TPA: NIPSNAP family protein [Puia sp.]